MTNGQLAEKLRYCVEGPFRRPLNLLQFRVRFRQTGVEWKIRTFSIFASPQPSPAAACVFFVSCEWALSWFQGIVLPTQNVKKTLFVIVIFSAHTFFLNKSKVDISIKIYNFFKQIVGWQQITIHACEIARIESSDLVHNHRFDSAGPTYSDTLLCVILQRKPAPFAVYL